MKFKVADLLSFKKKSVKPEPEVQYHVYSLPGFDNRQTPEFLMGEDIKSTKYSVQPKTILMNKLNVGFKRVWLIDQPLDNSIASTEFIPLSVSSKDELNLQYMYYFLTSRKVTEVLKKASTGTSNSHQRINADLIADLDIDLPSLREQKLIADKLAALDSKITLNQEINDNLSAIVEMSFQKILISQSMQEPIPLSKLFITKSGFAFKSKDWSDTGSPVVKIKDINGKTIDTNRLSCVENVQTLTKASQFHVSGGETVIALTGATTGKIGVIPNSLDGYINQRVGLTTPVNPDIHRSLIWGVFLQSDVINGLIGLADGSAQANLSPTAINNFEIAIATKFIPEFQMITDPLFELYMANLSEIRILTNLRDELLTELLS